MKTTKEMIEDYKRYKNSIESENNRIWFVNNERIRRGEFAMQKLRDVMTFEEYKKEVEGKE